MSNVYYETLKSRRSIRKFSDRAVEKDKIDIILKSALLTPSSRSIRPWEFVAVTDKETLTKLSQSREHSSQFLSGAALGIVVIADPELSDVWIEDASIASLNIQLSAQFLGLGSCWIQIRQRAHNDQKIAEAYVREVLGIPEKFKVESIIAIGYPDENKKPYDEDKLLYDKIHYGKY
ncbi:MAG: NAD(P)H nitroreductase [Clostridiales bacterium]|nr:NAD(P)H nitroreductase [Clostridiales bacterium]